MGRVSSLALAGAGVALLVVYALDPPISPPRSLLTVTPASTVPRLLWHPVDAPALTEASDFARVSGRLYVLDATEHRVVVLEQQPNESWRQTLVFGARGEGPGQLQEPTGITAMHTGDLAIIERSGGIHYFTGTGTHVRSESPRLPCTSSFTQLAPATDSALLVAANCLGETRDTLYAVLLWSRNHRDFSELARAPRMAVDGSWGTIYVSPRSLAEGTTEALFGVGSGDCLMHIAYASGQPKMTQRCGAATPAMSAAPPPGFREKLRARRARGRSIGRAYEWPSPLPAYMDKVLTARGTVLLRPFHAESLLLQAMQPSESSAPASSRNPMLVGSLDHLVGCNRAGCLWYLVDEPTSRLSFLATNAIEALIGTAPSAASIHPAPHS